MTTLTCISPIDGSVFATRQAMALDAARAAVDETRAAQAAWAARPLAERVALVSAGVAALGAMNLAGVAPRGSGSYPRLGAFEVGYAFAGCAAQSWADEKPSV